MKSEFRLRINKSSNDGPNADQRCTSHLIEPSLELYPVRLTYETLCAIPFVQFKKHKKREEPIKEDVSLGNINSKYSGNGKPRLPG